MLSFVVRCLAFAVMSYASYLSYKGSDLLRGGITDGRAEECTIIISCVALTFAVATRRRTSVVRVAIAWGLAVAATTIAATTLRWPPPLMMFTTIFVAAFVRGVEQVRAHPADG